MPRPRIAAVGLIAIADSTPPDLAPDIGRRPRAGRRLVLAAIAVTVAAGATAEITYLAGHGPASPGQTGQAAPHADPPVEPRLGPVVRPAAMQYTQNPPAVGDRLRALAAGVSAAPYDTASGRYTYIRTVGWNAVFDDAPGGNAEIIRPEDKQIWYAADASGRIEVTPLPAVYPNEKSRQYWQRHPAEPAPGATPATKVDDLPAGMAGPRRPLPADPTELAAKLGIYTTGQEDTQSVFFAVRDVYSAYLVPRQARAQILRALADLPGVSWRGTATDRAGRAGQAISVDTATARELLIFDPTTGALLAWDEIERPTDTVAGATLFLGYDRTDHLR